jgi:hypothetical protein
MLDLLTGDRAGHEQRDEHKTRGQHRHHDGHKPFCGCPQDKLRPEGFAFGLLKYWQWLISMMPFRATMCSRGTGAVAAAESHRAGRPADRCSG